MSFRIHFLVPAPNGPILSAPAGAPVQVSAGGRYVIACDPGLSLSLQDRGTGEPWGVRCEKCVATEVFQALKRPKPGRGGPEESVAVENGCC